MATNVKLTLNPEDLNLILVSLSHLPYRQVHELIDRIQREAGPQLLAAARETEQSQGQEPEN